MLLEHIAVGYALLGEKKASKPQMRIAVDSKNPKRRALIKKLKKNPNVRDPEALATWLLYRKMGGL